MTSPPLEASNLASLETRTAELERLLAPLYERVTGREASGAELAACLLASYETQDPRAILEEHIRPFVATHEAALRGVFSAYEDDCRRPKLFAGVSVLMVLERLQNDRFLLQMRWPLGVSTEVYDRMASIWGTPVPR
jgi:hypothetical protein